MQKLRDDLAARQATAGGSNTAAQLADLKREVAALERALAAREKEAGEAQSAADKLVNRQAELDVDAQAVAKQLAEHDVDVVRAVTDAALSGVCAALCLSPVAPVRVNLHILDGNNQ